MPTQPTLKVLSDTHVKPTTSLVGEPKDTLENPHNDRKLLAEVTLSASAVAALIGAIRIAASDQGNASKTWVESVDQNSAPSIACWLYAKILMTDRYHPTQRGYLPFVYSSAADACTAFFAEELRSVYPHLDKKVEAEMHDILEELMFLSGHLSSEFDLAWFKEARNQKAAKTRLKPLHWLGRAVIKLTVEPIIFAWFFLDHYDGGTFPMRKQAKVPVSPHQPLAPKPTTPAKPADEMSKH